MSSKEKTPAKIQLRSAEQSFAAAQALLERGTQK